jgi:hypothetical protein
MNISKGRLFYIWITSNGVNEDHAVTDEENAARLNEGRTIYIAVCGDEFIAADMKEPPGRPCARCNIIVQRWEQVARLTREALTRPRESPGYEMGRHLARAFLLRQKKTPTT